MGPSAPPPNPACAFTAELERMMAGLDCSLGQCSALAIKRAHKGVELRVSWALLDPHKDQGSILDPMLGS